MSERLAKRCTGTPAVLQIHSNTAWETPSLVYFWAALNLTTTPAFSATTGITFRLGDRVRVRAARVSVPLGDINFDLLPPAEEDAEDSDLSQGDKPEFND